MSYIDTVLDIAISLQTLGAQQKGFGTGMIIGSSNRYTGGTLYATFTSAAAMLVAGSWGGPFMNTDPEYLAAVEYFEQSPAPTSVLVGYTPASVAQVVVTAYPTVGDVVYNVTINGVTASYDNTGGGDTTKSELSASLKTAIDALSQPVTTALSGSSPNQVLTITATNAGQPFTFSTTTSSSDLTLTQTTADVGPDTGLTAIVAAGGYNWYGLIMTSRNDQDILQAAAWIEAQAYGYIFIACNSDSAVISNSGGNVLATLKGDSYTRTAFLWSSQQAHYPEAGWMGLGLPQTPGSWNWSWKTIAGITADTESGLTDTGISNLNLNNGNFFISFGGLSETQNGIMVGGQYIDVIIGRDWIKANIQSALMNLFSQTPKINYDDHGIGLICNALQGVLKQAVTMNILSSYVLTPPLASSFSSAQKQTRVLPNITWTGKLAGAVDAVTITGTLTN
jgi:hypothetical protein